MVKRMTLDEAVRKMSAHRILIGLTDGEKSEKATALTIRRAIQNVNSDIGDTDGDAAFGGTLFAAGAR